MTEFEKTMRFHRDQGVIKAIAELEIASHAIYNNVDIFLKIEKILKELNDLKEECKLD